MIYGCRFFIYMAGGMLKGSRLADWLRKLGVILAGDKTKTKNACP
jgi:hypothetical protein